MGLGKVVAASASMVAKCLARPVIAHASMALAPIAESPHHRRTACSRSAFPITLTEESAIAPAAIGGDNSVPVSG